MTVIEQRAYEAIISMAKKNEPDYWEKLKHQYAGMAMQGLLSDNVAMEQIVYNQEGMIAKIVANFAFNCATALVEKMKESV